MGGTKIAGAVLGPGGETLCELRLPTPRSDYEATIAAIAGLVAALEGQAQTSRLTIGVGIPGSISPRTGLVQNANSTWLNGRPFAADLERRLGPRVRLANDANCFALSEAVDGAGAGKSRVLGIILGTGCGSGRIMDGPRGIAGEWGHNPLPPMPAAMERVDQPTCWCGRTGCMEAWVSGPGMAATHLQKWGEDLTPEEIVARAPNDHRATVTLVRHASMLSRGLASLVNILDPDVIVLGGGLSELEHLYDLVPRCMARHIFCDDASVDLRQAKWGSASGVRGAAWLWPVQEA